ncbi:hypothetical protein C8R47DRAFT_1107774 [Mycena vitilis]|nr:hypothetical protein C8R47DRAFT_1107774 [Mycena vitilis]
MSASTPVLRLFTAIAWSLVCIALMYPVKDDLAGLALSLIASVSATVLSSHTTSLPASLLASFAAIVFVCLTASLAASVTALPAVLPLVVVSLGVLNVVVRRRVRRALAVEDSCELLTIVYQVPRRPLHDLSFPLALLLAARVKLLSQAAARYPTAFSLLDATKDSGANATEVDMLPEAASKDLSSLASSISKCIARFTSWTPATDEHRSVLLQPEDESDIILVEHQQNPAEARCGSSILRAEAPLFVPSHSPACRLNVCANIPHLTVLEDRSLIVKAASSALDPSAAIFHPSTPRVAQPLIPSIKNAAEALSVQWARGGCLVRISAPPASPSSIASKVAPLHVTPLLAAELSPRTLSANIRTCAPPPPATKDVADEDAARPGLRASIWAPQSPAPAAPSATQSSLSQETSLRTTKEKKSMEDEDAGRPGLRASMWATSPAPAAPDVIRPAPSAKIPSVSPPGATAKKDIKNNDDKRSSVRPSLRPPSLPAPAATSTASIGASATLPPVVKDKKVVADDDENRPGLSASIWASAPVPTNNNRAPRSRQPVRRRHY